MVQWLARWLPWHRPGRSDDVVLQELRDLLETVAKLEAQMARMKVRGQELEGLVKEWIRRHR